MPGALVSVVEKPVVEKPVVEKPVVEKPGVGKPGVDQPRMRPTARAMPAVAIRTFARHAAEVPAARRFIRSTLAGHRRGRRDRGGDAPRHDRARRRDRRRAGRAPAPAGGDCAGRGRPGLLACQRARAALGLPARAGRNVRLVRAGPGVADRARDPPDAAGRWWPAAGRWRPAAGRWWPGAGPGGPRAGDGGRRARYAHA